MNASLSISKQMHEDKSKNEYVIQVCQYIDLSVPLGPIISVPNLIMTQLYNTQLGSLFYITCIYSFISNLVNATSRKCFILFNLSDQIYDNMEHWEKVKHWTRLIKLAQNISRANNLGIDCLYHLCLFSMQTLKSENLRNNFS